jgi:hypothetical protein
MVVRLVVVGEESEAAEGTLSIKEEAVEGFIEALGLPSSSRPCENSDRHIPRYYAPLCSFSRRTRQTPGRWTARARVQRQHL